MVLEGVQDAIGYLKFPETFKLSWLPLSIYTAPPSACACLCSSLSSITTPVNAKCMMMQFRDSSNVKGFAIAFQCNRVIKCFSAYQSHCHPCPTRLPAAQQQYRRLPIEPAHLLLATLEQPLGKIWLCASHHECRRLHRYMQPISESHFEQ